MQAVNPLQIREADSLVEKENKIFVGMLPKTWTESDIQELFGRFGPLKEVNFTSIQFLFQRRFTLFEDLMDTQKDVPL